MSTLEEREAYCTGLEALASFLRENPEQMLPEQRTFHIYLWGKQDFATQMKKLGTCKKIYTEYSMTVAKDFGPISYGFYISRDTVCERKVVGKKIVPFQEARLIPAEPEHEEDIVEWQCDSILAEPAVSAASEVVEEPVPEAADLTIESSI